MKLLPFSLAMLIASSPVLADDGQRLVRSVSSPPGVTENPEPEGEHAFIKLMNFHVPSQNSAGELVPVEYYNIDDVLVKTEETAKPLSMSTARSLALKSRQPQVLLAMAGATPLAQ
ncbi:MAG: hypothetical protein ABFS39_18170 [Pseudomonadota bacterium]